MKNKTQKFLNVLFNSTDAVCFSETAKGTRVSPRNWAKAESIFFAINALHPNRDLDPHEPYHAPNSPRRADANVVCFRNFLIEIDDMDLDTQIDYVQSQIPVTAVTYSGGKSYHFIISLIDPCKDIEEYNEIARRLHLLLDKADKSCKNASRLSRLPEAIRPDTQKRQSLLFLNGRIGKEKLLTYLPKTKQKRVYSKPIPKGFVSSMIQNAIWTPSEIMRRFSIQGRNSFFFWLGNRMREFGLDPEKQLIYVEKAYENLEDKSGFRLNEAFHAARIKR